MNWLGVLLVLVSPSLLSYLQAWCMLGELFLCWYFVVLYGSVTVVFLLCGIVMVVMEVCRECGGGWCGGGWDALWVQRKRGRGRTRLLNNFTACQSNIYQNRNAWHYSKISLWENMLLWNIEQTMVSFWYQTFFEQIYCLCIVTMSFIKTVFLLHYCVLASTCCLYIHICCLCINILFFHQYAVFS